MVRVSYEQKPYRKSLMHAWGAEVVPSPSNRTKTGQAFLEKDPDYGCVGGGSNFSGAAFPFLGDKLKDERKDLDVVSCEPAKDKIGV